MRNRHERRANDAIARRRLRGAIKQWKREAKQCKQPLTVYLIERGAMIHEAKVRDLAADKPVRRPTVRDLAWKRLYDLHAAPKPALSE